MPPKKKLKCKAFETSFEGVDTSTDDESQDVFSVPPSPQKPQLRHTPWLTKYAPHTTSDICINPSKLKQVKEALYNMNTHQSKTKVLVLVGPCGSSKSTAIKLLAKEMNSADVFNDNLIEYDESENITRFLQSCKYKTQSVVLIEELPNVYHEETLREFREAIRQWVFTGIALPPLVICISEFEYESGRMQYHYGLENNMTSETLLGRELRSYPELETIRFNSLATRFLKKTVNTILKSEGLTKLLNDAKFDAFLQELFKVGDIRSIILSLEMWVKFYKAGVYYNRESTLGIFHAIGKVIYSSKEFEGDAQTINMHTVSQVMEMLPEKNLSLLNLGLLENYHIYQDANYDLSIAENIAEDLSVNDLSPVGEIGIRSTRLHLSKAGPKSSTSKLKMKFPRHFKVLKVMRRTSTRLDEYRRYISPTSSAENLNLIDGYYLPMIFNRKRKTRYKYNRLGGKLHEIYADENVAVDDHVTTYEYDQFQNDIDLAVNRLDGDNESDTLSDQVEESSFEDSDDGFGSDTEIDFLISQGKL
ncbi:rad17 [Candida margitis]|uniref:rad17 n=1 Tax=Candida margitis TaxID=1775924 RepID=UPI002227C510|nr:rad17 [Candida margitis]KAI5957395.1 rad17 [Candida margitis]